MATILRPRRGLLLSARCLSSTTSSTAAPPLPAWDDGLKARFEKLDCCALCDASGKKARVVHTVKPLKLGYKMAGRAHTVSLKGDFLTVVLALRNAEPDDVLMIDAGFGDTDDEPGASPSWPITGGMFGELLALEGQRKGLAGLVIDGNCRA